MCLRKVLQDTSMQVSADKITMLNDLSLKRKASVRLLPKPEYIQSQRKITDISNSHSSTIREIARFEWEIVSSFFNKCIWAIVL